MLKSFFVAYDDSEHAAAALEHTCFLAALTGGKVHVGHIVEMIYAPVLATGMVGGSIEYVTAAPPLQTVEDLAAWRKEREAQAESLFDQARQTCQSRSVACDTRCLAGYLEEEILGQARAVDLAAIGQSDRGGDRRKIGQLTEAVVRSSPQPVLIATAPYEPPTEVMILYDGGERSLHALGIGAEIARQGALLLWLVTVSPTREEGELVSRRASQYLTDHEAEFQLSAVVAQEAPDRELVTRLNDRPSTLVLMGAFGESRLREWLTGSTTRTILHETRNPLILFRH